MKTEFYKKKKNIFGGKLSHNFQEGPRIYANSLLFSFNIIIIFCLAYKNNILLYAKNIK